MFNRSLPLLRPKRLPICVSLSRSIVLLATLTLFALLHHYKWRHNKFHQPLSSSLSRTPPIIPTPALTNATILQILSSPFASHIIVSEASRLLFCPVPKAANSNWKYLIRKWDNIPTYTHLASAHDPLTSGLRYLSDYSLPDATHILTNPSYFRFLFVRDPYSRILSCYMDKFRNHDPVYTQQEYRSFLAQLFSWRYARSLDIWSHPRPSFPAFIDELLKHPPHRMNPHWMPQTHYCGIGIIPYDFIGHMEALQRDARHVFSRLRKPDEHFPRHEEIGFPPSGASDQLADDLFTVDLMFKIRAVYNDDFHLLGYI